MYGFSFASIQVQIDVEPAPALKCVIFKLTYQEVKVLVHSADHEHFKIIFQSVDEDSRTFYAFFRYFACTSNPSEKLSVRIATTEGYKSARFGFVQTDSKYGLLGVVLIWKARNIRRGRLISNRCRRWWSS